MIPIKDLTPNRAQGMRLGILLTRIERKEKIDCYPISEFEKQALPAIIKNAGGGMYSVNKLDAYWFSFSYNPINFCSN